MVVGGGMGHFTKSPPPKKKKNGGRICHCRQVKHDATLFSPYEQKQNHSQSRTAATRKQHQHTDMPAICDCRLFKHCVTGKDSDCVRHVTVTVNNTAFGGLALYAVYLPLCACECNLLVIMACLETESHQTL